MTEKLKDIAMYRALADELRTDILEKRYLEDDQLPTETELMAIHKVSRQTVRHAMQKLVEEGIVYRVAGRGTFPVPRGSQYLRHFGSIDELMGLSIDTTLELVTPLQRLVDPAAASRLRLDSDIVVSASFRRLHEDIPFCYTTVNLLPNVGSQLLGVQALTESGFVSNITVIEMIDKLSDVTITDAEQSISVAELPKAAADILNVESGGPAMQIDRIYCNAAEKPIELAISYFLPHLYSYRIRLRRSIS